MAATCSRRRVRAQRHEAATAVGLVSLEDVCATGCAVQEGGRAAGEGALGEHAAMRRSAPCYVLCCRAARDSLAATTTEAVGKLLGFRHTARRRLRRAGLWRSREPGVAGAGCDGAASAADAVSAAPHPVGNVWWWGVAMAVGSAPERGDGGRLSGKIAARGGGNGGRVTRSQFTYMATSYSIMHRLSYSDS